ncbi:peptide chain release factor N(5)-glutamine methyltransferase [Williamsoniiplasma lucivorax]|uniref:peptide chain release factor N(5)-glutamine methyltransferase n=1 Tax=Williamsoniiplasma lucivorax TaxID=209274 RepID=A0A2S5RFX6_9MOLU|nr:peptide chain release factor N(5)-glutamine methyltransferase [Williamsoniiplasma lucivorax]PPE06035.1 N5-glutamine S-adenosyl-L-methionine-dependent methyltransferase [Williamsoniiplasma lucivorax]
MTIRQAYLELKKYLKNQSEIYQLLEFMTGEDYDWLIYHQDKLIKNEVFYHDVINALIAEVPVAYIVKNKRFYGLDFMVDQRVLIPRVETEMLVEEALNWLGDQQDKTIIDLCTGSGNIGITLNKLTNHQTYLTDISRDALDVCQINIAKHQLKNIKLLQGDLLTPLIQNKIKGDLIVCNPPYIEHSDDHVGASTKYEPQNALYADDQGLKFYREMFAHFQKIINDHNNFCLIMEFGFAQKDAIEKLVFEFIDYKKITHKFLKDASNNWRCIIIKTI